MYAKDRNDVSRPVLSDESGILLSAEGYAAINGQDFYYATQGEVACSTTLNTTFTGLAIGNPTGSGKYYIMLEFSYSWTAVAADETNLALAVGPNGGLAADNTVMPCLVGGGGTSEAQADEGATLTTAATVAKQIASIDDLAPGGAWASPPQVVNLRGSIVLSPGQAVMTDSTYAIGAVMHFGFVWREVPIY